MERRSAQLFSRKPSYKRITISNFTMTALGGSLELLARSLFLLGKAFNQTRDAAYAKHIDCHHHPDLLIGSCCGPGRAVMAESPQGPRWIEALVRMTFRVSVRSNQLPGDEHMYQGAWQ